MAFSSFIRGGSRDAGVVRLTADTGEFNARVEQAERQWRESVAGMSREALKLDLAQDRLKRSLAKYGAESSQAKRATIGLKDAEEAAARAADRTTREYDQQQRSLGRLSRGALAGSGAFRGLGRSIAFASASFLGGAGLVYGLRQALKVGSNLNEQTSKSRAVFGAASREVLRFANDALGQAKDQALETASSIGALLRPLGVVERDAARISVRLTKLGTDLSSFYNTNVADSLTAIRSGLVGESEPLRRYGVQLSEARVQAVALAQSGKDNAKELTNQEKLYARIAIILRDTRIAQGDYARTIGGAANQEREFQKNLRNTEALIGGALQPAYRGLLKDVNDWLGSEENQKRLQRDVNEAIEAGTQVVKGLAGGLRIVKAAAEPVVDALGGIEKAAQLALIVGIVGKLRRAVLGFGPLQIASRTTATRGVEDAAVFGRAWDIATRPRTMVVTTPTAPVPTTGAPVPTGRGGKIPPIFASPTGRNVAIATAAAILLTPNASGTRTGAYDPKRYPQVAALLTQIQNGQPLTTEQRTALAPFSGKAISELTATELARLNSRLRRTFTAAEAIVAPGEGAPRPTRTTAPQPRPRGERGTGTTAPAPRPLVDIQTDLARARSTATTADDVRVLTELRGRFQRQISFLEHRKTLTDKQKLKLQGLYGSLAQAQGDLDAIANAKEQALADQREKARDAREKMLAKEKARQEAEAKRLQAETDRINRFAERNVDRLNRALRQAKSGRQLIAEAAKARTSTSQDEKPLTLADVRRLQVEFLQGLQGATNQFGDNISGQVATNTWQSAKLTGHLVRSVDRLTRGVQHPGAKYARLELMEPFGSVGSV